MGIEKLKLKKKIRNVVFQFLKQKKKKKKKSKFVVLPPGKKSATP